MAGLGVEGVDREWVEGATTEAGDGEADLAEVGDGPDADGALGEHRLDDVQQGTNTGRSWNGVSENVPCRSPCGTSTGQATMVSATRNPAVMAMYGGRHEPPAVRNAPMTRLNTKPAIPDTPFTAAMTPLMWNCCRNSPSTTLTLSPATTMQYPSAHDTVSRSHPKRAGSRWRQSLAHSYHSGRTDQWVA